MGLGSLPVIAATVVWLVPLSTGLDLDGAIKLDEDATRTLLMQHRARRVLRKVQANVAASVATAPTLCVLASAYTPVKPDSRCQPGASRELRMALQRGDTESAMLLLHSDSGRLENVTVKVGSLQSASGETLSLSPPRQVGFLHVPMSQRYESSEGWFADPLLPVPPQGMAVDAGMAQGIWIELPLDGNSNLSSGLYEGQTIVRGNLLRAADSAEQFEVAVPVKAFVSELPHLPSLNDSRIGSAWSGDWRDTYFKDRVGERYDKSSYFNMMRKYRAPADAIYGSTIRPMDELLSLAAAGDHDFNIMQVDEWLKKHRSTYCDGHSVSLLETDTVVNRTGGVAETCPAAVDALIEELRPTVEELHKRGILDRAYVYGYDEQPRSTEAEIRAVYGPIKSAFPKLRTHVAINWELPADLPVDIWTVAYQQSNSGEIDVTPWLHADPDRRLWWYHCIEPHESRYLNDFLDRTPVQGRLLLWLGAMSEATNGYPNGWLYYKMDSYLLVKDESLVPQALKRRDGKEANAAFLDYDPRHFVWFLGSAASAPEHLWWEANSFVYPGDDGQPVPSIRLASLRDGLEDWELFQQLPPELVSQTVGELVQNATSWHDDEAKLERLRAALLKAPWA